MVYGEYGCLKMINRIAGTEDAVPGVDMNLKKRRTGILSRMGWSGSPLMSASEHTRSFKDIWRQLTVTSWGFSVLAKRVSFSERNESSLYRMIMSFVARPDLG